MAFTTKKSLLAKVRRGDEISWGEFYTAYKPLIMLCGGDCNLTQDEKEELVQKVMYEIFRNDIVGRYDPDSVPENLVFSYDPAKGRFRHYLRKIIRYQAIKIFRQRRTHDSIDSEDSALNSIPSNDAWNATWDEEWYRHLLNMAMIELRSRVLPETFAAFEMYAVQNRPVQSVAEFLNLSVSSVYTAKSRCISILKEIIRELEDK